MLREWALFFECANTSGGQVPIWCIMGMPLATVRCPPVGSRPKTRRDCLADGSNTHRPCLWAECRYHLESPKASCTLDAEGPKDLMDVGDLLGISYERARVILGMVGIQLIGAGLNGCLLRKALSFS